MAIQIINTGSSANAGDGDSIRSAFAKVNQNFNEVVSLLGTSSTDFTQLVKDVTSTMLVHNSHTGLTATYNEVDSKILLTVTSVADNWGTFDNPTAINIDYGTF